MPLPSLEQNRTSSGHSYMYPAPEYVLATCRLHQLLVKERQMPGSRAYEEKVREQREVREWERQKRNGAEEGPDSKEADKRQVGDLKVG